MLTDLQIKHFAIIDDLHIAFGPGLCILSGETGAGKSIILGALNLILGGRASADLIRTGENEAVVEAIFDISANQSFQKTLEQKGVALNGSTALLVKRIISREDKNKVFINGNLSVLSILTEIAEALLTIAGQHEHQELLRPQNHLEILDGFGGLIKQRSRYRESFLTMQSLKKELEVLKAAAKQRTEREELLAYQWQEIEDAHLIPGEDDALKSEKRILQNAGELIASTHQIYEDLYSADSAVLTRISRIQKEISALERIDPALSEHRKTLDAVGVQLEDIAFSLRDYGQRLHFEPEKLEAVENRLELIRRLKKKYGETVEEILARQKALLEDREQLSRLADRATQVESDFESASHEARLLASNLSQSRRTCAETLCKELARELASLGMKDTKFGTLFNEAGAQPMDESGMDQMEFLFSPNPGEAPRPLSRIASGGELSRLMLAFKHLFARHEGVATLIFDEVDAGIGGATAEVVGQKLHEISRFHQTVCITHLPQIAVYGDTHYAISKRVTGGRTTTQVKELDPEKRVDEISRMIGGEEITQKTRTLAREMMKRAGSRKK